MNYHLYMHGLKALIRNKDGQYLLGELDPSLDPYKQSGATLPGGRLEKGETKEAALRREVLEETGISIINPRRYLGTLSTDIELNHEGATYGLMLSLYECILDESPQIISTEDHLSFARVSRTQMIEKLTPKFGKGRESLLSV